MPTPLRNVRSRGQSGKHLLALNFSGFDPSRKSANLKDIAHFTGPDVFQMSRFHGYNETSDPGGDHEATRVHHASRWHGGDVATRRARAATRSAGDRLPQQYIASSVRGPSACVRPGAERGRIY